MSRRPFPRSAVGGIAAFVILCSAFVASTANAGITASSSRQTVSQIRHVVIIFMENHSFNELLGLLCIQEGDRCQGTTMGQVSDGTYIPLSDEPDIPPAAGHKHTDQVAAMNGGAMNGWDHVVNCGVHRDYACLTQVHAGTAPTVWALADQYAIDDMTFETGSASSWGSHIDLVAATLDGFVGNGALGKTLSCAAHTDEQWAPTENDPPIWVPACVPDMFGAGPYRPSPVGYVPTIMDRMDAAGISWNLYLPDKGQHNVCLSLYECVSTQAQHMVRESQFVHDAKSQRLPNFSILIPPLPASEHNGKSMMLGENWMAKSVEAIMNGPDWDSTALFITYDDCGCFYDQVPPPQGMGIREPMLIVSPYAKPRYVDHQVASHASMLAFVEEVFGLPNLGKADADAYDFMMSFDFGQPRLPGIPLPQHRVPIASSRYMASHPTDPNDPT